MSLGPMALIIVLNEVAPEPEIGLGFVLRLMEMV
jgi:hypothetical protein